MHYIISREDFGTEPVYIVDDSREYKRDSLIVDMSYRLNPKCSAM